MAVLLTIFWDDAGTVIPGGSALYTVNGQPTSNYDNWFNNNVVLDMQKIIDDFQFELNGSVLRTTAATGYSNDFVIGSPQLDDDGDAAHDARMFFDKGMEAFRAGEVTGMEWDNANIGAASAAFGKHTTASGFASFAGGVSAVASAGYAYSYGLDTTASNTGCHASGVSAVASLYGQFARSSDYFSVHGDAQRSWFTANQSSVNATPIEMYLHWAAVRAVIAAGRSWHFTIKVIARENATGHSAGFTFEGVIERTGANTRIVGSPAKNILSRDNAAWDVAVDADDTNEALIIEVTGEAGKTIHWVASIDLVEVG